ncbi:sigma 54-interacting transcriptional regulator [Pendulispora albinea]|uniref:Sigma 54-interacting transcriptional regulator n=1 Tax=Pendulispora albinea TaxID=2741071 RepID=A0ABZ2LP63_9BACT
MSFAPVRPFALPTELASWDLLERAGAGATSEVWRARRADGTLAALKLVRDGAVGRAEAEVVARLGRTWGPRWLDAGALPDGGWFLATTWVDGEPLDPVEVRGRAAHERELVALRVALGVARGLSELHEAGVRHGDVKPQNIVLDPERATLLDLGLATAWGEPLRGATPRYASPELRERPESVGPEADLFALGVVLSELVGDAGCEPARWAEALRSVSPGARPSAGWVAERARRLWNEKAGRSAEVTDAAAVHGRIRRAYLAVRAREIAPGARVADSLGVPGEWLEEAIRSVSQLRGGGPLRADPGWLGPLSPLGRARWLVALVGPAAAAWPLREDAPGDGELVRRMMDLAQHAPPESWTLEDLTHASESQVTVALGARGAALGAHEARESREGPESDAAGEAREMGGAGEVESMAALVAELERPRPDARALASAEDAIARGSAPQTLIFSAVDALVRAGEIGRAWAALGSGRGEEALLRRAEIARRRGDRGGSEQIALALMAEPSQPPAVAHRARAIAARVAWDAGDVTLAEERLDGARGPRAAEVRALIAYRRGSLAAGRAALEEAIVVSPDAMTSARLMAALGFIEHADGRSAESARAYARAVELSVQAGAVVEEATYLTGLAAAATDGGDIGCALTSATRAALLWERLGRRSDAARAWLARASALATVGASHAADEAAEEAGHRAAESGDRAAHAYARWAIVETRAPGDRRAKDEATFALREIEGDANMDDVARATARLLVWAPDAVDGASLAAIDAIAEGLKPPSRWEWWGARAAAAPAFPPPPEALAALLGLLDVPAPLGSRGPALHAAARLAASRGDGDAARRFELARSAAARTLREHTPLELRGALDAVHWIKAAAPADASDLTLAPAQLEQLASIVRVLGSRDRLRPLLEQVLDAMVLWSGVERGLLLLRAPDGRLVPRAARNLLRRDLVGEQLSLSQGLARQAMETGDAVIAIDAFSNLGPDTHASVHALRLRSVLAVPLMARGETLGVVYLDDRVRRGAFGAREIAWVRLVAGQAAMAIADARDQVLLRRAVRRAERAKAELSRLLGEKEAELFATRAELRTVRGDARYAYDAIAGRSEPICSMLRVVDRVTASDIPVLLVGESGTGKELIARAMHANGARKERAFVSENCAAVPEPLLESTLFGHVRGAFTGAVSTRAGLFDVADGGTFFLDEVGEMPLAMQKKLLRVLQEGEVRPVGSDRTRKVDVRVVCATHRDLAAMVEAKLFREDLFYRLNVITIRVPPLRERTDDIPLLVTHFLEKHAGPNHKKARITKAAMDRLVAYPWPGNVRQLENEIRRAIVLADDKIDVGELSQEIARGGPGAARGAGVGLRARVDALEAELVRDALERTRGNQTKAAEMLGLSRFGLQKMMRRLNVRFGGG